MNTWKLNNSNSRREQANTRELTMQCMICDTMTSLNRFLKSFQMFLYTLFSLRK